MSLPCARSAALLLRRCLWPALAAAAAAGQAQGRLALQPLPASDQILLELRQPHTQILAAFNAGDAPLTLERVLFRWSGTPAPDLAVPQVVGLDHGLTLAPGQRADLTLVFPAYDQAGSWQAGLYFAPQGVAPSEAVRFQDLRVEVAEPAGGLASPRAAGWAAALLALLVLVLTLLVRFPGGHNFFQSPDGSYSVSRFQVWLWTVIVVFSYVYLFLSRGAGVALPDSIWGLLGIHVGSLGFATTLAVRPPSAQRAAATPPQQQLAALLRNPVRSMLSEDGEPSVMRLQMFAWTVAVAGLFLRYVWVNGALWDVPTNLLVLMGVSHGGYLVDKAARS